MQEELIGQSNALLEVLEHTYRLAQLVKPILVVGERGTGKELIAHRLHYLSPRWQHPMLSLNCATLAESLLESELFGHEIGAFTGANKRHLGRFERAQGGTLFLDELANTSLRVQEKLLRVIEYGEFERVGGTHTIAVNVRLVCATNQDLPALVSEGKFRADLLDRLAFDVITLPPLRARGQDIIQLAEHFAINFCMELGWSYFCGFSPQVRQQLLELPWRGNVRELKNVIERSLFRHNQAEQPLTKLYIDPFASPWRPITQPKSEASAQRLSSPLPELDLPLDLKTHLAEQELRLLLAALTQSQHHQGQAAQLLGLSYHQLRGLLRKHAAHLPANSAP
ncbi:phage shock protein operon transcriptional activator [Oceanisphaera avium]|uniref:Phage shock protein operon transcriptional activator n=1 Tax=Oceanisphaera avium TaxID=1903694 RepID=A0A1Y0CUK8_9GAMM|nr:phage shock protein operon transcriptional activator [Oceanisphaera avium]ART78972.1 phage shock protein operon transcriptional activator [Oceanisphaera avium]